MSQRGLAPILIILLIAGIILITPLPRYQQTMCNEMDPPTCYPASWKLSSSLWNELTIPSPTPSSQSNNQTQCKPCSSLQDTSCQGGTTCFIPESYSAGVCVPVPKMGQKYSIDQINNICGTSLSIDETVNWKTYTNQKYKYSLRYPPSWYMEESSDYEYIRVQNYNPDAAPGREYRAEENKGKYLVTITRYSEWSGQFNIKSIDQLRKEIKENEHDLIGSGYDVGKISITKEKISKVNGYDMYYIEEPYTKAYVLDGRGSFVRLEPDLDRAGGKPYFNQILSTFKFIQ